MLLNDSFVYIYIISIILFIVFFVIYCISETINKNSKQKNYVDVMCKLNKQVKTAFDFRKEIEKARNTKYPNCVELMKEIDEQHRVNIYRIIKKPKQFFDIYHFLFSYITNMSDRQKIYIVVEAVLQDMYIHSIKTPLFKTYLNKAKVYVGEYKIIGIVSNKQTEKRNFIVKTIEGEFITVDVDFLVSYILEQKQ